MTRFFTRRAASQRAHPRKFLSLCALALLAGGAGTVEAAGLALDPSSGSALSGGQVSFNLLADFDGTVMLGGAVDLTWNAGVLHFNGFNFDAGIAAPRRDVAFDVVDLQSSTLLSIGFANFSGILLPAGTKIGLLTFDVVGAEGAVTDIALADSLKWSGFFASSGNPVTTIHGGATFEVASAPVPLPASQWLLAGAFATLLGGLRRRRVAG